LLDTYAFNKITAEIQSHAYPEFYHLSGELKHRSFCLNYHSIM